VLTSVIFDLDGTLVDSVPGIQWSAEAAMRACGMTQPCRDLTPLIGPPIREILAHAAETSDPGELNRLEAAFRKVYDDDGWRRTVCQPGVIAMLGELRAAGLGLSVVTNKPSHATNLILPALAIGKFFQEVVCRDSVSPVFGSKAEMLGHLLGRQAIRPGDCIMVGDTMEDCHAAAHAGIACFLVAHGYGRGVNDSLPPGCRRIGGWDELVRDCLPGLPSDCVPALMRGKGEG
jgi:phosphoglycolate phosphatase